MFKPRYFHISSFYLSVFQIDNIYFPKPTHPFISPRPHSAMTMRNMFMFCFICLNAITIDKRVLFRWFWCLVYRAQRCGQERVYAKAHSATVLSLLAKARICIWRCCLDLLARVASFFVSFALREVRPGGAGGNHSFNRLCRSDRATRIGVGLGPGNACFESYSTWTKTQLVIVRWDECQGLLFVDLSDDVCVRM